MSSLLFAQVTTDLSTTLDRSQTFGDIMRNQFVQAGLAVVALIIINKLVRMLVARLILRSIRPNRYTNKTELLKRATTVTKVVQTAVSVVIWIIGFIFVLGLLKVNIAALATGAGLVSVIIGLSAQNTVKDFLNGIFIIIENQYGVGDIITVRTLGGWQVTGEVEDLSIRITKIRDLQGVQHVISNGAPNIISNNTATFSLVNISIRIGYRADLDKVKTIINQVGTDMQKEKQWKDDILEPIQFLRIDNFEEYAVAALMLGKVRPGRQYEIGGEFRARLLAALKANRIEVPVSQVVAGKANP